jgi:glycosyltransferase involved in cell wall biosynthesis
MAVGTPVVASPDAVDGMGITEGEQSGVLFGESDAGLADAALRVLESPALAASLSRSARLRAESLFGLDRTYGRWMREIREWLHLRTGEARAEATPSTAGRERVAS